MLLKDGQNLGGMSGPPVKALNIDCPLTLLATEIEGLVLRVVVL